METQREQRSIGELFSTLANQTSNLVRQEVNLARAEMTQKAVAVGRDAGMIGAGGVLAFVGLLALVAALIIALDAVMPLWLSALLVGLVILGVAYALIQAGLSALKRADMAPRQTIATLKEDVQWAKEQTK